MNQIRVLDLETTGFGNSDEILQIGIIDQHGNVLMNQFIKPVVCELHDRWKHALEESHGITPERVINCPSLISVLPVLKEITQGKHIIIYNSAFDMRFLPDDVKNSFGKVSCCMNEFTVQNNKKKVSLAVAAKIAGYDFNEAEAHDAIYDCKATLAVWKFINK
jgi:DNA polymerase-3 subunit epsilon